MVLFHVKELLNLVLFARWLDGWTDRQILTALSIPSMINIKKKSRDQTVEPGSVAIA